MRNHRAQQATSNSIKCLRATSAYCEAGLNREGGIIQQLYDGPGNYAPDMAAVGRRSVAKRAMGELRFPRSIGSGRRPGRVTAAASSM